MTTQPSATPPSATPSATTPPSATPSATTPSATTPSSTTSRALWVGTYPEAGAGTPAGLGEGIWRVELGAFGVELQGAGTRSPGRVPSAGGARSTGQAPGDPTIAGPLAGDPTATRPVLAATTPAPSFLAAHPGGRVLYAVGELAAGTVTAFAAGPDGRLGALAVVSSGGADPCHLLLAPDARTLYVTNYSSGSVGVLPLDVDGHFARATMTAGGPVQVLTHSGSGPDADRQEAPHAHSAAFAPGGAHLLVADLGTDELRRYAIATDGRLTPDGIAATLPPGTGPRHLAVRTIPTPDGDSPHPDGVIYLVGELDVTVRVLRWDGASATATLIQTLPACGSPARARPTDAPEPILPDDGPAAVPTQSIAAPVLSLPAHVVLEADRLLVSVRGADVLAEFEVDPRTGLLTPGAEVPVGGTWPRHFAVVDGAPLVANQHSGTIAALGRPASESPSTAESPAAAGKATAADLHLAAGRTTAAAVVGSVAIPAPACVIPAI